MKIGSVQHLHSRESGNLGSRDLGSRCEATPTTPLDSGLRRNDGGEAALIFIPLLGFGKAMGNSRESGNPESRDLGSRCEATPTPYPWIPACAGMTVTQGSPFAGMTVLVSLRSACP